jgi:hypothetical protein
MYENQNFKCHILKYDSLSHYTYFRTINFIHFVSTCMMKHDLLRNLKGWHPFWYTLKDLDRTKYWNVYIVNALQNHKSNFHVWITMFDVLNFHWKDLMMFYSSTFVKNHLEETYNTYGKL